MTEVRNDMEFVMNVVSRVALAIDCDVGAYRRANFAEQSHPADSHSGIRTFIRGQLKCDGTRAETTFRLSGETDESI